MGKQAVARGAYASNALTRIQGPGMNMDWTYPTCYTHFFTNIMKQHGNYVRSAGSYTEDATTGWPTNVAANVTFTFFIITMAGMARGYIRPGTYKARLSAAMIAAGWTCQWVDAGGINISSISAAGGSATCVVNDLTSTGDWSGTVLNLRVTAPGSGGPYNFTPNDSTAVECYLQGNEGRLDAYNSNSVTNYANMFDPDVIADLTGMKLLRFKDWAGTDIAALNGVYFSSGDNLRTKQGVTNYSLCRQESWRTWQMPTSCQFAVDKADGSTQQLGGMVPYSVQAKLARAVGAAAMIALPGMWNQATYDVDATTDIFTSQGHSFVNGDPVVLAPSFTPTFSGTPAANWTVYYVRDVVAGVSFKLARTPGGVAIDVTVTSLDAGNYSHNISRLYSHTEYVALYTSIATEMFNAAPGIDIIIDVSNEVWNTPQPYGYHLFADTVTTNTANQNAGSGYAWACMRGWIAFESVYPRSQIVRMISGQGAFFNSIGPDMYSYADPTVFSGKTAGQLIDAHCCETYVYPNLSGKPWPLNLGGTTTAVYTWGGDWESNVNYSIGEVRHMSDGSNYRCIANHLAVDPTNKPPNASFWVVDSINGLSGLMKNYTIAQFAELAHTSSMANSFWRESYRTSAEAYIGNRKVGFINYEGGYDFMGQGNSFFGFPDVVAVADAWMTFMRSSGGTSAISDYVNFLRMVGVKSPCYFIGAGQWRANSAADSVVSGLKRSHHLPDTDVMKAWRRISL